MKDKIASKWAKIAGSKKSLVKTKAARKNGKKGGRPRAEKLVVYNIGNTPVYIMKTMVADPFGGPGDALTKYLIAPGDGIDLSILQFSKRKRKA